MRYDANRVLDRMQELRDPRFSGAEGSLRTADWIGDELAASGYDVVMREVVESRFPDVVAARIGWFWVWCCFTLLTLAAARARGEFGIDPSSSLVATFATIYFWYAALRGRFLVGADRAPRSSRRNVVARRPVMDTAGVRVLFMAALDASDRRWPPLPRALLLMVWPLLVVAVWLHLGDPRLPYRVALISVAGLAAALLACEPFRGGPAFDHRPGLALLAEIAQAWSRSADRKVEAWFVATGANAVNLRMRGGRLESASRQDLVALLAPEPDKPTLAIQLLDPGAGKCLELTGRDDSLGMVIEAAQDQWIPHRYVLSSFLTPEFGELSQMIPTVTFLGDHSTPSKASRPAKNSAEPALLTATAQLATELALRWAKRARAQEESFARSSQNTG